MVCFVRGMQNGWMYNEGENTGCGDNDAPPKARIPSWFPLHSSVPIPSFPFIKWRAAID